MLRVKIPPASVAHPRRDPVAETSRATPPEADSVARKTASPAFASRSHFRLQLHFLLPFQKLRPSDFLQQPPNSSVEVHTPKHRQRSHQRSPIHFHPDPSAGKSRDFAPIRLPSTGCPHPNRAGAPSTGHTAAISPEWGASLLPTNPSPQWRNRSSATGRRSSQSGTVSQIFFASLDSLAHGVPGQHQGSPYWGFDLSPS